MMSSQRLCSHKLLCQAALSFVWIACATSISQAQTTPPPPQAPATQAPPAAPTPQADLPDSPGATSAPKPPPVPTGPTAVLDTSMGRLTCKLYDKQAPIAAANFIGLATGTKEWIDPVSGDKVTGKSYYNGTTFHRVIPEFMIQGGDRRGDGTGDAGFFFDNEVVPGLNFDVAGRLAMANAGPNTNGTQFFITELPYPDLDGKYTIFGQCDAHSVLIVSTITRVDRNRSDKPTTPVTLDRVTIVPDGQPMPPPPTAPAPTAPSTSL